MAKVEWTPAAESDLENIAVYIGVTEKSRQAATRFIDRIVHACEIFATQPHAGLLRTDLGPEIRCIPVGNYVVFYRPIDDGVEVARVVSGFQDLDALFASAPDPSDPDAT